MDKGYSYIVLSRKQDDTFDIKWFTFLRDAKKHVNLLLEKYHQDYISINIVEARTVFAAPIH